jgi:cytoskeleton protein RodZ
MLRETREEKGLTLDDISKALIIKKPVISAIESGDWNSLPPPVYVKGYVNQYAALLNIVDLLEAELARVESQPPPEAPRVVAKERVPKAQRVVTEEEASKRWTPRKKVATAVAVGVIALGFIVFLNLPKTTTVAPPPQTVESTPQAAQTTPAAPPPQTVESTPQAAQTTPGPQAGQAGQTIKSAPSTQTGQTTKSVPSTQATPPNTKEQPAEASPAAAEEGASAVLEPKKLTIVCQDTTWVRITIDGHEEKEFMLKPEEVVKLQAKESFDLLVGNAGGVKLLYNGKDTGFSGETGEVKQVRLP